MPRTHETWTLQRQFIVPLGLSILVIAGLISLSTAWVSQRLEKRLVEERFDRVAGQLHSAQYPLNASVLNQIRNYSGMDVALFAKDTSLLHASFPDWVAKTLVDAVPLQALSRSNVATRLIDCDASGTAVYCKAFWLHSDEGSDVIESALLVLPKSRLSKQDSLVWAPAVTGMLSVLILVLIASWLASNLAKRVRFLEAHVNQLSTQDYTPAILPGPQDALYRLSERINSLSQQLSLARTVIAKTERARLISMVASGMAHEIRNAITGASLLVETFAKEHRCQDNPELQMAFGELDRASVSIKRILASDPEADLTDEADLPLHNIFKSLTQALRHHGSHQNVGVTIQPLHLDCVVPQGDAVLACLLNLAMNAIEATGPGGRIEIESELQPMDGLSLDPIDPMPQTDRPSLIWRIWDDGPGPSDEIAGEMTEPFVSSKPEGAGLGLAMVKKTAKQLGGHLNWFRKENRTCFEFAILAPESLNHQLDVNE